MQQPAIALTRRPVKDKGALMQTLHLRFRALRAISPEQSPSRWPTPSMRSASTWKGAPPLPNLPSPTLAVGSRPARSHQRLARCPTVGAGLPLASPLREVRVGANAHPGKPDGADNTNRVCPRQTATSGLSFPLGPRRFGARSCGEKTADPIANVRAPARISSGAWARLHHRRGEGAWPATTSP